MSEDKIVMDLAGASSSGNNTHTNSIGSDINSNNSNVSMTDKTDKTKKKTERKTKKTSEKKKEKEIMDVSDDTMDILDSMIDQFNETKNLSKKITLQNKLNEIIKSLETEINNMIEIVDKLDLDQTSNEISNEKKKEKAPEIDLDNEIINIEKQLSSMEEEDVIQKKVQMYGDILNKIRKCRSVCDNSQLKIYKCNT